MRVVAQAACLMIALALAGAPALAQAHGTEAPRTPNGLALTPPMGWNSWNTFSCNVDEALIRRTADLIVSSGMKDAGYEYVVIDDCWHGARDAEGNIQADARRFPSGVKALADYVHSKGLKFGLYSDAGAKTCAGRPGSRGYEYQDARQYARWGVDYLKYDWCDTLTRDPKDAYKLMSDALRATGRPIVLSICEWGTAKPWEWGRNVGNLWRTTGDIYDAWEGVKSYSMGIMNILDKQAGLESHAGPGGWNDPDMLEVGNEGLTLEESRSHFSLWALLAAPLIAGNDLSKMTPEIRDILTNREVIAVNQDPGGVQGRRILQEGDREVWMKPLKDGSRAVILLNRGAAAQNISVQWGDIGVRGGRATVRDLWAKRDAPAQAGGYSAVVPSHGVAMLIVRGAGS